jgi:serine/threonine-protein kinase
MSLKPGDQLDHYCIDQHIAETPTSSIFKAVNLKTGGLVALKVPQDEAEADVLFYERFQREAAISRELNHPGVPKVVADERLSRVYFAMEWVEGTSLRRLLSREGKLPAEQVTRIALAICDVLGYLHKNGIVHRDLKPENVILCPDQSVKLIDFSIASKAGARRLTFGKLSQVMGTADYISPEQVKGQRGDARSDLYALGVMLVEMLSGEMPFRGGNPLAIMNDRLLNDPLPIQKLNPDVAPYWQTILGRLLQRDPRKRYGNAAELADDLENPAQVSDPLPATRTPAHRRALLYSGLALLPTTIFLLILYVARHQ